MYINLLEDTAENTTKFTTADIVILAVIGAIVLGLIIYFVIKKSKGKAILNDCDCGPSGSDLVKKYNKKYKKDQKQGFKPVDVKPQEKKSSEPAKEEAKSEVKEEKVETKVEEKTQEEKSLVKETVKTSQKKETSKKEVKNTAKPEEKASVKEEKENGTKVYHLSKRASDNKWQVFIKGSDKVIKLFDTKVEAEEYCERMAKNQGATLAVHKSKGENKGKISKSKVKAGK